MGFPITRMKLNNLLIHIDTDRLAQDDMDSYDLEDQLKYAHNYIKMTPTGTDDPLKQVPNNLQIIKYDKSPFLCSSDDVFGEYIRDRAPYVSYDYSLLCNSDLKKFNRDKFSVRTIQQLVCEEVFQIVRACFVEASYIVGGLYVSVRDVRATVHGSPYGIRNDGFPIVLRYQIELLANPQKNISVFTW